MPSARWSWPKQRNGRRWSRRRARMWNNVRGTSRLPSCREARLIKEAKFMRNAMLALLALCSTGAATVAGTTPASASITPGASRAAAGACPATAHTDHMPNAWPPRPGDASIATSIRGWRLIGSVGRAGRLAIIDWCCRLDRFSFEAILNHMVKYDDQALDRTFAALGDPTRRALLARLGKRD